MTTLQRTVKAAVALAFYLDSERPPHPADVSPEFRKAFREFKYWQMRAGGESAMVAAHLADHAAGRLASGSLAAIDGDVCARQDAWRAWRKMRAAAIWYAELPANAPALWEKR